MPSPLYTHARSAAAALLALTPALGQPPEHALGAFLAASATEFRWNLPLLALVGLSQFPTLRASGGVGGLVRALALAPALWAGAGFAEVLGAQTSSEGGGLWGAPLHLLLAGALPVSLCLHAVTARAGRLPARPAPAFVFGVGAAALGSLGLL